MLGFYLVLLRGCAVGGQSERTSNKALSRPLGTKPLLWSRQRGRVFCALPAPVSAVVLLGCWGVRVLQREERETQKQKHWGFSHALWALGSRFPNP